MTSSTRATVTDFTHVFLRGVASGCAVGVDGGGPGGSTGSGGGPRGTKPDRTPPRISGARLTHARFSVTHARTAVVAIARARASHTRTPRHELRVLPVRERVDDDRDHAPCRRAPQRRPLRRAAARSETAMHADRNRADADPETHAARSQQHPIQRACRTDNPEARALPRPDRRARCLREPLDARERGVDRRAALRCPSERATRAHFASWKITPSAVRSPLATVETPWRIPTR